MPRPALAATFAAVLCSFGLSGMASAVPVIETPSERVETTGFFGVTIPFAANPQPRLQLGVQRQTIGSDGSLVGGAVAFSFDPWNHGGVQLRATATKGTVGHAAVLGGGWDLGTGKPFATLGVRIPDLSISADIGAGGVPSFALGLDSLTKETAPDPVRNFPCSFAPTDVVQTGC